MTPQPGIHAETDGVKLPVVRTEEGVLVNGTHVQVETRGGLRRLEARDAPGTFVPVYVEEFGPAHEGHEYMVYIRGEVVRIAIETAHDARVQALRKNTAIAGTRPQIVRAPMPGLLKSILVSEGDVVAKGESVCILEAMKMENELKSTDRLRVRRLLAAAGMAVDKGAPLLELEPVDSTSKTSSHT